MALQGSVAATAADLQDDLHDDFAGFSDHLDDAQEPGDPSQFGSDSQESSNYSDDDVNPSIRKARYYRFGPPHTVEALQDEFNAWAKGEGFAVNRRNGRNR